MSVMSSDSFAITPVDLVRNALAEAGSLLAEREWTQGTYRSGRALCCAGAINMALTGQATGLPRELQHHMSDTAYRTIHAVKAAFLRRVSYGCTCKSCRPVPAREVARRRQEQYPADAVRRVALDWYDAGIANWNDRICPDRASAIGALLTVQEATVRQAVDDEFGPDAEVLHLPTLAPLPALPTPRRVLALV